MKMFLTILIFIIFSCNSNSDKIVSNRTLPIDSTAHLLIDSGLIISVNTYKIEINTTRSFNNKIIPIRIFATIDNSGLGNIDSLYVKYRQQEYKIVPRELLVEYPMMLVKMKSQESKYLKLEDYNFDSLPDIVIYNSTSGMKNIMEDKFLYSKKYDKYIFNEILSECSNCRIDEKNKRIHSGWILGMASMIYRSATYMWENDSIKIIESVKQDYHDSLDMFIREIRELKDSVWQIKVDTLT